MLSDYLSEKVWEYYFKDIFKIKELSLIPSKENHFGADRNILCVSGGWNENLS